MEIKLQSPVEITKDGVTTMLDRVTLREARGKDLRKMDRVSTQGEISQMLVLVEVVTGLPPEVVDEIGGSDLVKISNAGADFLPGQESDTST